MEVNEDEINRYLPGVLRKLSWLSTEDLLKRVLSLEFNRLLDYYKDAPKIDFIDEKPKKDKKDKKEGRERSDKDKDRRTADRGMARIYINVGKGDGFYAGNLIEMLNKNISGPRVDVGRIDLLPGYSLFDIKKGDAHRVVSALKGLDFFGKRIYSEIADPERDYAHSSDRKSKAAPAEKRGKGKGKGSHKFKK